MRRIIILTWVSGSGKTTIQEELLKLWWNRPINCTTRQPRGDYELDEYLFLDKDQYFAKLRNGDFLEHTNYGGNRYAVCNSLPDGNVAIILDPVGRAMAMSYFSRKWIPYETYYLEISKEEQKRRLKERGDTADAIKEREKDFNWFHPTSNCFILSGNKQTELLVKLINGVI